MELDGARVLITGASSGIGARLAEAFADRGARLGLAARREDRLRAVAGRCADRGAEAHVWRVDLGEAAGVDELARTVVRDLGGVDVLVNNAGIPKRRHVTRLDPGIVEHVMRVNFLAAAQLTLALLPGMLDRRSGHIINMSSVAAPLSSPGEAAYDASKAALASFSEAMAVDLWDTGVHVLTVYPGVVDTELFTLPDNDPFTAPVEPIGVGEAVDAILGALERDALEVFVPGYFRDLAVGKATDTEAFLAGAAAYVRDSSAFPDV